MTISDQLRKAIKSSGMSRYRIAKHLGMHQSTFSRFIHGERGLRLTEVDRLGKLLKLELTKRKGR